MQQVNILLVDDRPENLLSLETVIADPGHKIIKASSGEEALKALLDHDFAVIILDVWMKTMDGFETAALIRERDKTSTTPIIFITAFSHSDENMLKGYSLGAVDFLFKPVMPEVLKAKVAVFAELYRNSQQIQEQAETIESTNHELASRLAEVEQLNMQLQAANHQMEIEINRRLEAEKALQNSEKLYRTLAQHLPQTAVFLFDRDIRFLVVEGTLLDSNGHSRQNMQTALEGKTLREAAPSHLYDWLEPYCRASLEGNPATFEWPINDLVYLVQVMPVRDETGEIFAGLAMLQDITEAKRAEAILRDSNDQLEIKVRERTEALEKQNHKLELLSQAGQLLTAMLKQKQILNQLLSIAADLVGADGSSAWLCQTDELAGLQCQGVYLDGRYQEADEPLADGQGLVAWVAQQATSAMTSVAEGQDSTAYPDLSIYQSSEIKSLLAVPLLSPDGVIGVLQLASKQVDGFSSDDQTLIETLAASASVAIDNARLLDKLSQQADDLRLQNEDLDAFSYTVAHDLKNPLSTLLGFSAILQGKVTGDPEGKRCADMIQVSGQKINNIIDELLLLAKVRSSEVQPQHLDMRRIVLDAQQRLTFMIQNGKTRITAPDQWPGAMGHPQWVEEVWVNYISNAIKYGGHPPTIELGWTPLEDGMIRFWVRDNGMGLNDEQKARLFAPFTRLNQVQVEGNGLGLSIVRRIVEKLGGEVGVESELGDGSIFSFTLPANPNVPLPERLDSQALPDAVPVVVEKSA